MASIAGPGTLCTLGRDGFVLGHSSWFVWPVIHYSETHRGALEGSNKDGRSMQYAPADRLQWLVDRRPD